MIEVRSIAGEQPITGEHKYSDASGIKYILAYRLLKPFNGANYVFAAFESAEQATQWKRTGVEHRRDATFPYSLHSFVMCYDGKQRDYCVEFGYPIESGYDYVLDPVKGVDKVKRL